MVDAMTLSDAENRQLHQIGRSLAHDPDMHRLVGGPTYRQHDGLDAAVAGWLVIIGVGIMLVGLSTSGAIAAAGALVIFVSLWRCVVSARRWFRSLLDDPGSAGDL